MPEQNHSASHLVVPLETGATSFCYYENPAYYQGDGEFLPLAVLRSVGEYAGRKNLAVNFLYGNKRPPQDLEKIIESMTHVKILPLKLMQFYREGVFVVNRDDYALAETLGPSPQHTFIVRLEKSELTNLAAIVDMLLGTCGRLNLILLDIGSYSNPDFAEYKAQLMRLEQAFFERIRSAPTLELSILTDRLLLKTMNNCGAGMIHLTVGFNGGFYLCPGFYHDRVNDSVGSIDDGIMIRNQSLLRLEKAPICSLCDAYHCKRCLYFNNKLTLEINTPSHQQCVASHLERNCSRLLRQDILRMTNDDAAFAPIPELSYLDPLEVLLRGERGIPKET